MNPTSHNTDIVLASGAPTWFAALLLLVNDVNTVPLWFYIVSAVIVPLVIAGGSKAIDIYFRYFWKRGKELGDRDREK